MDTVDIKELRLAVQQKADQALIDEKTALAKGDYARAQFFKGRYTLAQFVLTNMPEDKK